MFIFDSLDMVQDFLERGGRVLWLILFILIFLWTLIVERFLYYRGEFQVSRQRLVKKWMKRGDRSSWCAVQIRRSWISQLSADIYKNISLIKVLVSLCPLLGLLGTVTGMISVFDVMGETGTGNARLMASGISKATLPTMSGMVAALSGLYLSRLLEQKAQRKKDSLMEAFPMDESESTGGVLG